MVKQRLAEIAVGLFIIVGFLALLLLALQVSGISRLTGSHTYKVKAAFSNIGGLREQAPVKMAGVEVGHVQSITLLPNTYQAQVSIAFDEDKPAIPKDSTASIMTEGLLGSQYISIDPGFSDKMLTAGDAIAETHSAMILENLIGQFLYSNK
jgi:phospholipid/cholesterol/gamma-HCH transport system substrate-binding protein